MVRALDTVTNGKSLVRTRLTVTNNTEAAIDGVRQEPISKINSSDTVATTSFGGTSDAGTRFTVTPTISVADYVTVNYRVEQSSFVGDSVTTADGATVPPPKRSDSLSSTVSIPDSHVVALGGLMSTDEGESESRVPLLGDIPVLGLLFRNTSKTQTESRFYVFIRATILRRDDLRDLRNLGEQRGREAGIADELADHPPLQGIFVE
jgi:general secretion pathway protein D